LGTVVCFVDRSTDAEALRAAAELTHGAGLRLVAVHVVPPIGAGPNEEARAKREAQILLDRVISDAGLDRSVDKRVEIGEAAREVARIASEEAASLIVLNTQPHHWWRPERRDVLADDLTATAPCPVMVAPHRRGH
jgi:nucleotide-binding universal stress UspA family protein